MAEDGPQYNSQSKALKTLTVVRDEHLLVNKFCSTFRHMFMYSSVIRNYLEIIFIFLLTYRTKFTNEH